MSDLQHLAAELAASGIETVFGIPGSGASLTLCDALASRGVAFTTTHSEASAAIMAGIQSRVSGRTGAAISIKGPGLANMIPGLAACRFEALPLVAICEAYPPDVPASKAHKRMDHEILAAPTVKGRRFLSADGPGFDTMSAWAEREAPGPVLLDIAATAIASDAPPDRPVPPAEKDPLPAIRRAEKPVVIAGTLAVRQAWSAALNRLAVPVFSTAGAKGVVDETLPQAAGVYTGVGLDKVPEREILDAADLVVGLGLRSSEVLAAGLQDLPAVNVDPLGAALSSGFDYQATAGVDVFADVVDALATKNWGLDMLARSRRRLQQALSGAFLPAACYAQIEHRFAGNARIVIDTGYFCTIAEHAVTATRPDRFLGSGLSRYMGIALPMAVGAALHDPALPTILAIGDGGIGMFAAELRLAVAHRSPLLVVLMSDGGFGSVRTRAIQDGLIQSPMLQVGGSWLQVMSAMGLTALAAADETGFADALAQWEPEAGPAYIEATFDPERYQDMVQGIRA